MRHNQNDKPTLLDQIKYKFDTTLSNGFLGITSWLLIITILVIALTSYILYLFNNEPDISSYTSFFWIFLNRTLDPGNVNSDEGTVFFITMTFLMTLFGIFVVSTLIGLITAALEERIENLRRGRSRTIESGHTVIFGWSHKVLSIIQELAKGYEGVKKTIVVFGDKDKTEMEEEVYTVTENLDNIKVICRRGIPGDLQSPQLTSVNTASAIILLSPDKALGDIKVIKNLLAITKNPDRREAPYHITAEIQNPRNVHLVKLIGGDEVSIVSTTDLISDLVVQTSRQSGLPVVYNELTSFEGSEFYTSEPSEHATLYGKEFREICHCFQNTTIIGFMDEDNQNIRIAPKSDTIFEQGQKLILIGYDKQKLLKNWNPNYHIETDRLRKPEKKKSIQEKLLILGWNEKLVEIIKKFEEVSPESSSIVLASNNEVNVDSLQTIKEGLVNIQDIKVVNTDITDWDCLKALKLQAFDKIIIVSEQDQEDNTQKDAQGLIILLHVRSILQLENIHRPIISEMLDIQNKELAETSKVDDFIVSDQLVSSVIAQYAATPSIRNVFNSLLDLNDMNIGIHSLKDYIAGDHPVNYHTAMEAAFKTGDVLIGYQVISEMTNAKKKYGIYLNPPKTQQFDQLSDINLILIHNASADTATW